MITFLIIQKTKDGEKHEHLLNSLKKNTEGEFDVLYLNEIEGNFKNKMIENINSSKSNFICILREECFLYEKIKLSEIINKLNSDDMSLCFSLILGKNVEVCYQMQTKNTLYGQIEEGEIMTWDWSKHYLDFGNPFYMDGTIFRKKEFLKMIKNIGFDNSQKLEEALQEVYSTYPKNMMSSFVKSKMIVFENVKFEESIVEKGFESLKTFVI